MQDDAAGAIDLPSERKDHPPPLATYEQGVARKISPMHDDMANEWDRGCQSLKSRESKTVPCEAWRARCEYRTAELECRVCCISGPGWGPTWSLSYRHLHLQSRQQSAVIHSARVNLSPLLHLVPLPTCKDKQRPWIDSQTVVTSLKSV